MLFSAAGDTGSSSFYQHCINLVRIGQQDSYFSANAACQCGGQCEDRRGRRLCGVSQAAATARRRHFDAPTAFPVSFNPLVPRRHRFWRRRPSRVSCSQLDRRQRRRWPKSLPICFLASQEQEAGLVLILHRPTSSLITAPVVFRPRAEEPSPLSSPAFALLDPPASDYSADVTVTRPFPVYISTCVSSESRPPHQSGTRTPAAN